MNPIGAPDFSSAMPDGAFLVLPAFQRPDAPAYMAPSSLDLARDSNGIPQVCLRVTRPVNPMLPPEPFAIFELRLKPVYDFAHGLEVLRSRVPQGRLEPVAFHSGYLRMTPQAEAAGFPGALASPVPLAWNGLDGARYDARLTLEGAAFVQSLLTERSLPVSARAEMEVLGVAQRVALRVRFDPSVLAKALAAHADAEGRIPRERILGMLEIDPTSLGLVPDGDPGERRQYALAILDRIRSRMAAFVPAPAEQTPADPQAVASTYLALRQSAAETASGQSIWDLAEPEMTFRPLVLGMNPLDAARQAIATAGLQAIVPPPVIVPPIASGVHAIRITANLPENRAMVPVAGVSLHAPAAPPARPQAQVASAELNPPDDAATVLLRLSPAEPLRYRYRTFVMIEETSGPRRIDGDEIDSSDERLRLSVDDFPIRLLVIEAERDLLELAEIAGSCRWSTGEVRFTIGPSDRDAAVPLPREAAEPLLEIQARPREAGIPLTLGPLPARSIRLGLPSFPEYGPHAIEVVCGFDAPGAAEIVAIDLVPEGREAEAGAAGTVALTRNQSRKEWRYIATSPFRPGYRFRVRSEGESLPWSDPQSPFAPLQVDARVAAGGGGKG